MTWIQDEQLKKEIKEREKKEREIAWEEEKKARLAAFDKFIRPHLSKLDQLIKIANKQLNKIGQSAVKGMGVRPTQLTIKQSAFQKFRPDYDKFTKFA